MDNMGRGYCYIKCSYYVLINCIRHCVRGEFIQNYFNILSFLLIWDKNLGSHTGWPVAKTLWIRPWLYKDGCASCKLGSAWMLLGVKTAPKIKLDLVIWWVGYWLWISLRSIAHFKHVFIIYAWQLQSCFDEEVSSNNYVYVLDKSDSVRWECAGV